MPSVDLNGEEDAPDEHDREVRMAGGLLLRSHLPNLGKFHTASTEDLELALNTTARHLRQLQHLGMCVVTHATVMGPEPDNWQDDEAEIAYSASAFVPDTQPLHVTEIAHTVAPEHAKTVITDPLSAYLQWCLASKEPYVLWDIFTCNQYAKQMSSGVVFLTDIDPVIAPSSEESIGEVREDLVHLGEYFHPKRS